VKVLLIFNMNSTEAPSNGARLDRVLRLLRDRTSASIGDIAAEFHVSGMTIRRDLHKLEKSGQVIRTPGGARIARSFGAEKTFVERLERMSDAKERIGRAAASLVADGSSVALDSGTTTLYIARHLSQRKNLVVFTFSLAVLEELAGCDSVRLELTGGVYRPSSHDLIGSAVQDALLAISADTVFFGAAALSFQRGVMVNDPDAQRALLRAGRRRILVLDSSKIGAEALYSLCPLNLCDLIVTDRAIGRADLARLRKVAKVMVAT
jgi:DeoR family transcriptional regulator, aga operon transcriptional repressor